MNMKKKIILAITGASGMIYTFEFLELLRQQEVEVHGVISDSGRKVLGLELGLDYSQLTGVHKWFSIDDFSAPIASGSSMHDAMVILPCTVGTLGAIANGFSGNLIHRAADVSLKEKRPLVLAVRESPLNRIHLTNMLKVHEAGGIICPPIPSFYNKPKDIKEMARYFSGRLCDQIGIEPIGINRWQGVEDVV